LVAPSLGFESMKKDGEPEDEASGRGVSITDSVVPTISKYIERLSEYVVLNDAHLELYRFDVKKLENGISINIEFRVRMKVDGSNGTR
jgi:hypothetical protein